MKFNNYTSVYFQGADSYARHERTKDVFKSILEIFWGTAYNGLGWKVEKFSIETLFIKKEYTVDFLTTDDEISIKITGERVVK